MITNSWVKLTAWAAGLVALGAGLFITQVLYVPIIKPVLSVLLPISVAVALALLLGPTIDRMQRRGLSRGLSVTILALAFLAAVAILAVFLIPALVNQATSLAGNMPKYVKQVQDSAAHFMSSHEGLLRRLHLPTTPQELASKYSVQIQSATATFLARLGTWLTELLSTAVWLVLIPIVTIFLVVDIDRLKAKALLLVPEQRRAHTTELANSVGKVFGAYIRGLLSVSFFYGVASGLSLALWGVPYAVVLGALAGALYPIPYIGTYSTLAICALVTFVSAPAAPLHVLGVAITILVVNQVFDSGVTPRVVGKAVGVHPALMIVVLLIGARLFGIVGMILAVPVTASIQIIVLEFCPRLRGPEREEKLRRPSLFSRLARRARRGNAEETN